MMGNTFFLKPFAKSTPSYDLKSQCHINNKCLCLDYDLSSFKDVLDVYLPKFKSVNRKDELWKSTCFECFLFYPEGDYYEINLSPTGDWNSYHFDSYRAHMKTSEALSLVNLSSSNSESFFHLQASFEYSEKRLPSHIQLSAVLLKHESMEAEYWAIQHNYEQPDFHKVELAPEYRWD